MKTTHNRGNSIGVDYHDGSIQICVLSDSGDRLLDQKLPNDIEQVIRTVRPLGAVRAVAVEACCGSAAFADALHARTLWAVRLAHPGYVQRMRRNPDKTDFSDAQLLGDLTRVGYLPEVWLAPPFVRQLREVTRYRQQQVEAGRKAKLRIRAILRNERVKAPNHFSLWTQRGEDWLQTETELNAQSKWVVQQQLRQVAGHKQEVRNAEKRLHEMTAQDALVRLLLQQKGIGLVTACVLRAEVGTFKRFQTGKQLARFCGLSPRNASSGQKQADAGLIKAANPILKTALIEGAHSVMRWDSRYRSLAAHLAQQGKPRSVILAAIANRWVRKLFHELKACEPTANEMQPNTILDPAGSCRPWA